MVKADVLRSKVLYKALLISLKIIPMLIALCYMINTVLAEEAAILSGETAMQILNEALYNIAEL